MNRSVGITLFATLLSQTTLAGGHRHTDFAQVTDVEPVYKTVEHRIPRESCWTETVRVENRPRQYRSGTPTLVGGIIGGAIGHELGNGKSNRKIGAVVGSILGASVARDIQYQRRSSNRSDIRYEDVERCEVSHTFETEEILQGYNVSYRYHGDEYQTFMHDHPGNKIRVAISVRPL